MPKSFEKTHGLRHPRVLQPLRQTLASLLLRSVSFAGATRKRKSILRYELAELLRQAVHERARVGWPEASSRSKLRLEEPVHKVTADWERACPLLDLRLQRVKPQWVRSFGNKGETAETCSFLSAVSAILLQCVHGACLKFRGWLSLDLWLFRVNWPCYWVCS